MSDGVRLSRRAAYSRETAGNELFDLSCSNGGIPMRSNFLLLFAIFAASGFQVPPLFAQQVSNSAASANANRLTHLDEFCNPYSLNSNSSKLTTPQWIGEAGVDAVITLGIDDMRDPAKYEAYLRPLLNRLKKIDGRAPVSIMTCSVDPKHEQLQKWLEEGLSIECHTIDHPCPCLQGGSFDRAKDTYDRCVDLMNQIPNSAPVAFRFPCMDSLNTPSPRAFSEIVNQRTAKGNFLQISTSVTCLFTPDDPTIQQHFVVDEKSQSNRFKKYVPFPSFVNQIQNYPFPYLIGNQCWEFPCTIPDDWQGQNLNRPNNPLTVNDLKAAVDATVTKKGIANIIFHPHGWIRAEQLVEVVDHVEKKYGKRVKFLTFKECLERINRHLLKQHPVRHPKTGLNNGVRLLDLNGDGYTDVLVGNERDKFYRIWNPQKEVWQDYQHPMDVAKTRLGVHQGNVVALQEVAPGKFDWHVFSKDASSLTHAKHALQLDPKTTSQHLRLRDLNNDGLTEIIVAANHEKAIHNVKVKENKVEFHKPGEFPLAIVDEKGQDNGLRFVDLDENGFFDLLISNDTQSGVFLFQPKDSRFVKTPVGTELPRIVSNGKNGGTWFARNQIWVQNEHTHRLPDGVDRKSFQEILFQTTPSPKSPQASLNCIKVTEGFQVELMAAEPLVQDPIAIEWGLDGKLWVVEMADYPLGVDDRGKPGGRVRYLEDTNQDGKYDRSTIFVQNIPFPTGVLPTNTDPAKPACLISAAPYVLHTDQKGSWNDLLNKPGAIKLKGFGEGNQQHRFNGFSPGLDNWLYLANGDSGGVIQNQAGDKLNIRGLDLRIRLNDPTQMEAQTGQTQFGRHHDGWGNWFGCSNPIPLRQYVLPDHYLKRNQNYSYPSARIDIATAGNTQIFPRSRVLSHWSGYKPPAAGQAHRFTSACSTDFYRDSLFGPEFRGNSFTCEPVHNLVHRRVVTRNGVRFDSSRVASESDHDFVSSSDSWFRPTTVKTGPDGALWITDMYRLVIEHPEWIDDQQEKELFLRAGHDRGRIYRVYPKNRQPRPLPGIAEKQTGRKKELIPDRQRTLIKMLETDNRWYQETGQRFLVQLSNPDDKGLVNELAKLLEHKSPTVRLHAICTLDGLHQVQAKHLVKLFMDPHPEIRRNAIRISENLLSAKPATPFVQALCALRNDPALAVRMQLAFSLGYSTDNLSAATLAELGHENFDDIYIRASVFSSLNDDNIARVIHHADRIAANSDFQMQLFQQAALLGKPELALDILKEILKAPDPARLSTKQLEMVVQLFGSISKLKVAELGSLKSASTEFEHSIRHSIKGSDSDRRKLATVQLTSRSIFIDESDKLQRLSSWLNAQSDVQFQKSAVAELALFNRPQIATIFVQKWRSITPEVRQAVLTTVRQRSSWSKAFLEAVQSGKVSATEFSLSQRNGFLNHSDQKVAALAEQIFKRTLLSSSRKEIVDKYLLAIGNLKQEPDLEKGKKHFEKRCSQCHRVGTMGNAVGPDLVTLKDPSLNSFVQSIIQPNLAVEDKYRSYVIALLDGRELSGLIQAESSTQLEIVTADGKPHQLPRNEIDQIKSTGKSLMPEGLETELNPEAMFDLVSYLQVALARTSPKQPRKKFDGNQPATVSGNSAGVIVLPATKAEIYGPRIVFESKYKNLGFWGHVDDMARWSFEVSRPGEYFAFLNYACPADTAGNSFRLTVGGKSISGKVQATSSWDNYRRVRVGSISLSKGTHQARFFADEGLKGFLLDLQSIEFVPANGAKE